MPQFSIENSEIENLLKIDHCKLKIIKTIKITIFYFVLVITNSPSFNPETISIIPPSPFAPVFTSR